jgi:hypothetical protein
MQAATCEAVSAKATSLVPLDTLSGLVKASIKAGDNSLEKAEQHYKAAGLYLVEARERLPVEQPGKKFTAYIVGECRMGTARAYELIAIAEGRLTLEEIRAKKNESSKAAHAKTRAAAKSGFPLNSGKTNSEPDEGDSEDEVAEPAVLEDNILHAIGGMNENARVFNKLLRIAALDREAVARINTAIDRMIGKWRSIQSTLEKRVVPAPLEPTEPDDPIADSDHKKGLRVIAARGFLNRAKEAKEICTIEKLQASDVTEAMIKAADDAGAVWTATAHNLRRMKVSASTTDFDSITVNTKPAPKKLPPDELAARRKRKAEEKTFEDYSKQFGGLSILITPDVLRRMEDSLTSGVDEFAELKAEQEHDHAEYVREETLKRATLNAPLLAPITREKEQAYVRLIKTRTLYEGACGLSWQEFFDFRDAHPECEPLTRGDLAYARQWTPCAVIPEADAGTITEKALRERAARLGLKVARRGTEYTLRGGEDDPNFGGSLEGVIDWLDLITPTMDGNEQEDMTIRQAA